MFSMCLAYFYLFFVPVCFIVFLLLYLLPLANKDIYSLVNLLNV